MTPLRNATMIVVAVVTIVGAGNGTSAMGAPPADEFVRETVADPALPQAARDFIDKAWADCDGCDGEEFLAQGIAVVSPRFRQGLDAYDNDSLVECAAIMRELRDDPNPYVSVNASAYEVKALVAAEKNIEAGERIKRLFADDGAKLKRYSYFAPEMAFLKGYSELSDLQYEAAAASLKSFLENYEDASQRLTLSAQQMLAELENRQAGRIGEVVDLMTFSGRRLKSLDSGKVVQERQARILELLDKMIKDAEKQEQQSQSGSSSSGGGGGGGDSGNSPNAPMQDSNLPGGATPGTGSLRESRRASPGDAWGAMPPAQRKEILQALRDSFPGQYRRLVEQYYTELAKKK